MKISCPDCNQHYEIDRPNSDGRYQCKFCGKQFKLAEAPRLDTPAPTPTQEKRPSRAVAFSALILAALALLGVLLLIVQSPRQNPLQETMQTLKADNEALRAELAAVQQTLDELKGAKPAAQVLSVADQKRFNDITLTVEGIRSWQSRYSPTLDQVMKIVETQSLEQAFAQINQSLARLYAPQGDFARVYAAINLLSNATTENLVILNADIAGLTAYSGSLANSITQQGEEFNKLNRDIGNLFGRVRSLERNNNYGVYFLPSPRPTPPPRPPQPKGASALPTVK